MNNIIKGIIYLFTNTIDGKHYVGQTIHEEKRFGEHKRCKDKDSLIDRAIQKYGLAPDGTINYEVIYRVEGTKKDVQEALNEKEQYFIKAYNSMSPSGYNLVPGGTSRIGWHPSDESRKKMSLSHVGHSPSNKGKKWNEEERRIISERTKEAMKDEKVLAKFSTPVSQYTKDGQFVRTYPSMNEASRLTNAPQSTISLCCNGKCKSSGGFVWRFA